MINFNDIQYLKNGNHKQKRLYKVLTKQKILDSISAFNPIITGTIPIEIDVDCSDVDICCFWIEKNRFIEAIRMFSYYDNYLLVVKNINNHTTVICRFEFEGFDFEIFGQNRPVYEQEAYQHMIIEHKILIEEGEEFKKEIIRLKKSGIKTEPAFGKLLGFVDDPYKQLLEYLI